MYVCNSEKITKIGQYLRKLWSNEKGFSFFDSQCIYIWTTCMHFCIKSPITAQTTTYSKRVGHSDRWILY